MRIDVFKTHKLGNDPVDYEDAAWPEASVIPPVDGAVIVAVADGATESSFAATWARALVSAWENANGAWDLFAAQLPEAQRDWWTAIDYDALPWYAQHKVESGAFAAFVGCLIAQDAAGCWVLSAEAVGDCCVMVLDKEGIAFSHPLSSPDEFHSAPRLIGSRTDRRELEHRRSVERPLAPGESVYLLSDAIAAWAIGRELAHRDVQTLLGELRNDDDFLALVAEQRALRLSNGAPALKNDDVTIVRVTFGG